MPFPILLTFLGGQGPNFRVEVNSIQPLNSPIRTTPIDNVKFVALDGGGVETGFEFSFVPGSDQSPPATSDTLYAPSFFEYFNWRTGDDIRHPISKGTNPSTGEYSFDFWPALDTDRGAGPNTESELVRLIIEDDYTWEQWRDLSFNTTTLNSNKHTVFYDYGTPVALGWKLGGTCTVSESPTEP